MDRRSAASTGTHLKRGLSDAAGCCGLLLTCFRYGPRCVPGAFSARLTDTSGLHADGHGYRGCHPSNRSKCAVISPAKVHRLRLVVTVTAVWTRPRVWPAHSEPRGLSARPLFPTAVCVSGPCAPCSARGMSADKAAGDFDPGAGGPAATSSPSHDSLPGWYPELAYDETEERRVRRKLDLRVLPVCLRVPSHPTRLMRAGSSS